MLVIINKIGHCLIFQAKLIIFVRKISYIMSQTKSLGEELKVARTIKGLSLREVEDLTGISNSYLSQLENDKIKKPSVHILHKLAKLYEVGFERLLEASGIFLNVEKNNLPTTLVGAALYAKGLTPEEESLLNDYLAFLRFKNKKNG